MVQRAIDVTALGGALLSGDGCNSGGGGNNNEKDNNDHIKHDDPFTWPKDYSATDI